MPAAKKAKKNVDVRKPADRKALEDIIAAHPITIILIHADWCGHCQTYKEKVWSQLEEMPEKKNGLAAIHHDQLEGTRFSDARIKGYPSVIVVGKKKTAEFEDENGVVTNAIPTEEANDLEKMKEIVRSAEPSTLTSSFKNMRTNVDAGPSIPEEEDVNMQEGSTEESPELSNEAKASRKARASRPASGSPSVGVAVPDPTQDVLDTQKPAAASQATEFLEPKKGGGGNLYHSLLAATRDVAPAAALVAAAVVMGRGKKTRRSRKGRQGRKGRRTSRRSRN